MAGVLPCSTRMRQGLCALGYTEVEPLGDSLFGHPRERLRGHEFHYSELVEPDPKERAGWAPAWGISKTGRQVQREEGFARGPILASYVHVHFASRPGAAGRLVEACRRKS